MTAVRTLTVRALPLMAALLLGACGATSAHTYTRATTHREVTLIDGCVRLSAGTRAVTLHPAGADALPAVLIGAGTTTFVLSNESDENLCSWLPFARTLTAHGYSALL